MTKERIQVYDDDLLEAAAVQIDVPVCIDANLTKRFNRPRAYDTAYLAQLNGCEFWTADEKLYNAVKGELAWVRWVGEISADRV